MIGGGNINEGFDGMANILVLDMSYCDYNVCA